jgi:hypothetical protein
MSYMDVLRSLEITGYDLGIAGCTEKESGMAEKSLLDVVRSWLDQ